MAKDSFNPNSIVNTCTTEFRSKSITVIESVPRKPVRGL